MKRLFLITLLGLLSVASFAGLTGCDLPSSFLDLSNNSDLYLEEASNDEKDEEPTDNEELEEKHVLSLVSYKEATCTASGNVEHYVCSHCDKTFSDKDGEYLFTDIEIPALGHDEISHSAKDATCTEKGYNKYVTCSRCDFLRIVKLPRWGTMKFNIAQRVQLARRAGTTHTLPVRVVPIPPIKKLTF